MMRIMLRYYDLLDEAIEKGVMMEKLKGMKCRESIGRMATVPNETFEGPFKEIEKKARGDAWCNTICSRVVEIKEVEKSG